MIFPQVNMNGTDGADLALAYNDAANKMYDAIKAMRAPFHGRDYQTLPVGTFELANKEMMARVAAATAVMDEIHSIVESIAKQL